MNYSNYLTAQNFADEFLHLWNEEISDEITRNNILEWFQDDESWTGYMLEENESFLRRLGGQLEFNVSGGFFQRDVVYFTYGDQYNFLFPIARNELYPNRLHVIIEHENGERVEQEMYSLLFLRSPLKVLIFYDYTEVEKTRNPRYARWLDDKLNGLFALGKRVHDAWPEASGTEYLILVGNCKDNGHIPNWRYWIVEQSEFRVSGARLTK